MRPRLTLLALAVLAAIACGAAWLAVHREPASLAATPRQTVLASPDASAPAVTSTQPERAGAKAVKAVAVGANPPDWPDSRVPVDQAVPRLLELADAGDANAQVELSRRLNDCTSHGQRVADDDADRDRRQVEYDKSDEHLSDELRATRAATGQWRMDENMATREACKRLPPEVIANWLDPLDRAAHDGDINAMRTYAWMAIAEYDSVRAIVADVDTAILRRDKARAYLREGVRLGDVGSLVDLAYAYYDGVGTPTLLFAADAFQSYAYAYAATLASPSTSDTLNSMMSTSAQSLDPHRFAAAQAEGRRIYEQCCARH